MWASVHGESQSAELSANIDSQKLKAASGFFQYYQRKLEELMAHYTATATAESTTDFKAAQAEAVKALLSIQQNVIKTIPTDWASAKKTWIEQCHDVEHKMMDKIINELHKLKHAGHLFRMEFILPEYIDIRIPENMNSELDKAIVQALTKFAEDQNLKLNTMTKEIDDLFAKKNSNIPQYMHDEWEMFQETELQTAQNYVAVKDVKDRILKLATADIGMQTPRKFSEVLMSNVSSEMEHLHLHSKKFQEKLHSFSVRLWMICA